MSEQYHQQDLVRLAREVLTKHPALATHLSINEDAGTVSDRRTGELWGVVTKEWTAMSADYVKGWSQWPVKIHV